MAIAAVKADLSNYSLRLIAAAYKKLANVSGGKNPTFAVLMGSCLLRS